MIPESFSIKTKNATILPGIVLNTIDKDKLLQEDKIMVIPNRYGVVQEINIDIKKEGIRTEIAGKGSIWQYEINSSQAYSLGISFGKFIIPEGSKVFIYNKDHSQYSGAFTSRNNNFLNQLTIADFKGQMPLLNTSSQ